MARPRKREKNLDTNYSMRIRHEDRDRVIKNAECLGMSLNKFTNKAVLQIIDLLECEDEKLPHSKDLPLIALGRFMREHPSLGSHVKI